MSKKRLNKEVRFGIGLIFIYLSWALFWAINSLFIEGTPISPYLPESNMKVELIPPFTDSFLLGTDIYGRSILELLSSGLTYSISIGLLVTGLCSIIGITVGYLSIVGNRFLRSLCDLFTNLIFVFPSILIAIVLLSFTGQSFWGLVLILTFTGWPSYAKLARGETQRLMGLSYVESAKAMGCSRARLFFKIIVPGIFPVLSVHIILGISGVIISEATLGFLGLGGSTYSWGALLSLGKTALLEAPYIVIIFSLVLAGLIIGLNLLGDGLRDYLDPKTT